MYAPNLFSVYCDDLQGGDVTVFFTESANRMWWYTGTRYIT